MDYEAPSVDDNADILEKQSSESELEANSNLEDNSVECHLLRHISRRKGPAGRRPPTKRPLSTPNFEFESHTSGLGSCELKEHDMNEVTSDKPLKEDVGCTENEPGCKEGKGRSETLDCVETKEVSNPVEAMVLGSEKEARRSGNVLRPIVPRDLLNQLKAKTRIIKARSTIETRADHTDHDSKERVAVRRSSAPVSDGFLAGASESSPTKVPHEPPALATYSSCTNNNGQAKLSGRYAATKTESCSDTNEKLEKPRPPVQPKPDIFQLMNKIDALEIKVNDILEKLAVLEKPSSYFENTS